MRNLGLLILLFLCIQCNQKEQKPFNVLFIAVDDLRPELNAYGKTRIQSPHIDRLAREGTTFTRAYCNVPVCGASRASILTGLRPTRERFLGYDTWVDKDAPGIITLPMHFKNHGYYTISNGKVAHHQGDCEGVWDEEWRPRPQGTSWRDYLLPENLALDDSIKRGPSWEIADVPDSAYFDGKIAVKTIRDLQKLKEKDQPFFLAVGFFKPHLPFNAPKKYWDLYDPADIGLADNPFKPENAPDAAMHNFGELRNYHGIPPTGPLPDTLANRLRHGYHACVSYTDAQIGHLLNALDELGLRQNTIVILWGDHGFNLGEHGLWCKHCNFNTSLNAPLIISAPGYAGGQKTFTVTEFIDIYPTLSELSGLELPEHLDGLSLVSVLKDPEHLHKNYAVSKYGNGVTLIQDQFFYTEWRTRNDSIYARMLYDHQTDPDENINISERPETAQRVKEMSTALLEKRGVDF
ncbi:MAG: sulfatase [Cyclobacteriaceae bacterium]|nr:sulfatase [Cyclobacteriaceae bacterium]